MIRLVAAAALLVVVTELLVAVLKRLRSPPAVVDVGEPNLETQLAANRLTIRQLITITAWNGLFIHMVLGALLFS